MSLNIKATSSSRFGAATASQFRQAVRKLDSVEPVQRSDPLQCVHIVHARIMRAVEYVHAHVSHGVVGGEAARRGSVGHHVEELERGAACIELVARVAGEVETQVAVVVEDGGVDGAVHEHEYGVGRGGDGGGLNVGHDEVMVWLENGAGGHGGVEYHDGLLVVIDGLDLVAAGGGEEEEAGVGAVERAAELGGAAAVVDAEGVVDGDVVAEVAAEGGGCGQM